MSFTFARLSRAPAPCIRPFQYASPLRTFSTTRTRLQTSIPTTPTCPSPTCECASFPPDLDIDRKTPLLNTMASYAEQVILCTGTSDWHSNIEQDDSATGTFVKGLKSIIGKGGEAFDPFHNVLITASSLQISSMPNSTTALLFPSFKRITSIPHTIDAYRAFASAYLKTRTLHPMHDPLSSAQKSLLLRDDSFATHLPAAEPITKPTVLICGHAARDSRCGILGPLLQTSFEAEFARRNIDADVAQISHIGGHKYAGNVIVYVPPSWNNALRGCGIWYGRVVPESVEGLVGETVRGRVVVELLRGGITAEGGNIGRIVEKELVGEGKEEGLRLRPMGRGR